MDNRIFNVNGNGDELLLKTLELVFAQQETNHCEAWRQTTSHGLILYWMCDAEKRGDGKNNIPLPSPLTAKGCLPFVLMWLAGDFAKSVKRNKWDESIDHDGDNGSGWRVYCEDWGHVDDDHSAICAIKPVTLWYGK